MQPHSVNLLHYSQAEHYRAQDDTYTCYTCLPLYLSPAQASDSNTLAFQGMTLRVWMHSESQSDPLFANQNRPSTLDYRDLRQGVRVSFQA